MQVRSTFTLGAARAEGLTYDPIDPSWIIDGDPRARTLPVANCGIFKTTIWDCSAGSFFWYYSVNETVNILEGEVTITDMAGGSRTLMAGDAALFAEGDWLHWHVPHYVKKFAVWGQPLKTLARYSSGRLLAKAGGVVGLSGGASLKRPAIPVTPSLKS